ncbi:MAG: cyclic nucleotide-binding domain-containing protein, partial [Thermoanaerobaculia bacterium]
MQTAELLGTVPLFKLLDVAERADLEPLFERRTVAAGERVFSLGEPGDSLYIVGMGSVELFVKDNTGAKIVLAVTGP